MPLTLAQKSNCRRHLGYPVVGLIRTSPGAGSLGAAANSYRYNEAYGYLEFKLNNLNPDEEARLLGVPLGAVAFVGPQPNAGDTVTLVFTGGGLLSPITIGVTAQPNLDPNNDARITLCNQIAQAIITNANLAAVGISTFTPYNTGAFALTATPFPEISFTGKSAFSFTAMGTGQALPQITADGSLLNPSVSLDGGTTTTWGYLPILDGLETAYGGASDNLDTAQADVWKHHGNELAQRMSLYQNFLGRMEDFLGVPRNQMRRYSAKSRGVIQYG